MYPSVYQPKSRERLSSSISSLLRRRRAFSTPSSSRLKLELLRHPLQVMKGLVFSILFCLLFLLGCGEHEQESYNSAKDNAHRNTKETNPEKVINKAISIGDFDQVKALIESQKVSVNQRDSSGKTLLMKSVISREYAIVEYLRLKGAVIKESIQVVKKDAQGRPVVVDGKPVFETKEQLLKDVAGKTIYDYADGDSIILAILNKEKFETDFLTKQVSERAIPDLNVKLLSWLLEKGGHPNLFYPQKKSTALIQLMIMNTSETEKVLTMLKILLKHPQLEINAVKRGKSAIMILCNKRHSVKTEDQSLEMARLLLQHPEIDLTLRTKSRRGKGKDCIALAEKKGNHRLANLIKHYKQTP